MASLPKLRGPLDWPVWIRSLKAYSRMLDPELWDQINPENTAPVVHETMPKLPETHTQVSLLLFDVQLKRFDHLEERESKLYGMIMDSLAFPDAQQNVLRDPGWSEEGLRGLIKAVKKVLMPNDRLLQRLLGNQWNCHVQQTVNTFSAAERYIARGIALFYDCATYGHKVFDTEYDRVCAVERLIAPIAHLDPHQHRDCWNTIKDGTKTTDEIIDALYDYKAESWFQDYFSRPPHQARSSRRR